MPTLVIGIIRWTVAAMFTVLIVFIFRIHTPSFVMTMSPGLPVPNISPEEFEGHPSFGKSAFSESRFIPGVVTHSNQLK